MPRNPVPAYGGTGKVLVAALTYRVCNVGMTRKDLFNAGDFEQKSQFELLTK